MRVAFHTLGCKVNQFETQALMLLFREAGHTVVPFAEAADAYLLNTCTVTAVSDKKSRQMLRRLRREHPDAVVVACGCFSQTHPEELSALGVCDVIAGSGDRKALLGMVEQAVSKRIPQMKVDQALSRTAFEMLPVGGGEHTRAMLKVEDGCENFCTYCIIPYARGRIRSLTLSDAVEQAKELAETGYREIVITGIEISSYGSDLTPKTNLETLIFEICRAVPTVRIRLGSLEPSTITEAFCSTLAGCNNLCPQFHLSLQSGCDATLARMRRKYETARFLKAVSLLREAFPGCAITTDLICGFPGETEAEFEQTLETMRTVRFSAMHIFPYSKRAGTPAARMLGQIPRTVKEDRARRAGLLAKELSNEYLQSLVGQTVSVLFEEAEHGVWRGHCTQYMLVEVASDLPLHNQVCDVEIEGTCNGHLTGRLASKVW